MGYRGKVEEQARARELRAEGKLLADIATELGVSKSSVSLWVRDVDFTPSKRRYGPQRRPNRLARLRARGDRRSSTPTGAVASGHLDDAALPRRRSGVVRRRGLEERRKGSVSRTRIPPSSDSSARGCGTSSTSTNARLRAKLYLHRGSRSGSARRRSGRTSRHSAQPISSAVPSSSRSEHPAHEARDRVRLGLLLQLAEPSLHHGLDARAAILGRHSGVAQLAERSTVNRDVVGSSPTPGAHATASRRPDRDPARRTRRLVARGRHDRQDLRAPDLPGRDHVRRRRSPSSPKPPITTPTSTSATARCASPSRPTTPAASRRKTSISRVTSKPSADG